jgi:predicted transcriptional regulator
MYLQKVVSKKLVGVLKVTEEKSRIRVRKSVKRIRVRTKMSGIQYTGYYPVHGSAVIRFSCIRTPDPAAMKLIFVTTILIRV